NQKLLTVLGPQTTLLDAFKAANQVLQGAVQGIAELITRPGLINVDFADVRTVMAETGMAMMGSGAASGEGRARAAAEAAVRSPLTQPREREFAGRADPRELRAEPHMRMVRRPLSSSDYAALDKPTVQRQRAVGDGLRTDADPEDVLDIPAFLRRQAD